MIFNMVAGFAPKSLVGTITEEIIGTATAGTGVPRYQMAVTFDTEGTYYLASQAAYWCTDGSASIVLYDVKSRTNVTHNDILTEGETYYTGVGRVVVPPGGGGITVEYRIRHMAASGETFHYVEQLAVFGPDAVSITVTQA